MHGTDVFADCDPPRHMTVEEWVAIDRQWHREHRCAHAKYQRGEAKRAKDEIGFKFWTAVLHRNKE